MLRLWLATGMYVSSAWATTPPERPEPVPAECPKAYAVTAGHEPTAELVDPATHTAVCSGLLIPTSLVAYYVELESWSELAVVEIDTLKAERPTVWETWGERVQWLAVGVATGITLYAVADPS